MFWTEFLKQQNAWKLSLRDAKPAMCGKGAGSWSFMVRNNIAFGPYPASYQRYKEGAEIIHQFRALAVFPEALGSFHKHL